MICYLPMNRNTHQLKITCDGVYFNTLDFALGALKNLLKVEQMHKSQKYREYEFSSSVAYIFYGKIKDITITRQIYNEGAYSLFYKNEYMEDKVDEFIKTVLNNLLQFGKYRVIINGIAFYSDMYYFFFNEEILTIADKKNLLYYYEVKYRNIKDIEVRKIKSGE